jgi:ribosomal protein L31
MSKTIIVSTSQNSFKFINEFDSYDKSHYDVNIKVEEKLYVDGKSYYDISYEYKFNGDKNSKQKIHPFYNGKEIKEDAEGVIIFKNKMTEIMVEYLLYSTEELEKVSGTTTAQCYRTNIMLGLAKLWD